ncbi:DUF1460 domain-containing protein [Bacteroidales bacterium OttesenSCG-928-M06]|nr:DUF1460 domain-containing protein [Bacteroidales bacterium OttesenSCG-928-M06]
MKTIYLILLQVLLCFCNISISAQEVSDSIVSVPRDSILKTPIIEEQTNKTENEQIVQEFLRIYSSANYSPSELVFYAAKYLLNTPYMDKTLEIYPEEQLVVNLKELDCMTFVENCLALSRTIQYPYPDFDYFVRQLRYIRYRGGVIIGYPSRLHYTCDWITDNINKNVVEDITCGIGGKKFQPSVSFMSSHKEKYPVLRSKPEYVEKMKEIEAEINQRTTYYFIPKNELREALPKIKNGDIICFTTDLTGLDISHMGVACWDKRQLTFIHASSKYKKVILNPESLVDYCTINKHTTGIIVLRVIKLEMKK